MNRGDPIMTIYRVIEATWAEQVKDHMTGQCMSALATACSSTISSERVGLGNRTLGLRRRAIEYPDRRDRTMFTSIRKYRVKRGSMEEYARRVQEGFVPLTRQMPGFRGYYLLDGGPDVLITISMFDSADEAVASNVAAADWVRNNVLDLTKGMPDIMIGNALIAEVGERDPERNPPASSRLRT